MKNLSRSTRSTTSRMLSATSFMEETLPSKSPKTPARRRRDEYRLTSLLSSPTMETGLAIHQGTSVEVLPRGVLQQDGGASRIRKVTNKHHILVRFPGACLQRPIGKVQIRQSSTAVETWVRTPFWLMGEDTLRYLITWVRTPYQRSG